MYNFRMVIYYISLSIRLIARLPQYSRYGLFLEGKEALLWHLPTYLPTYLHTSILTYLRTYLPSYLSPYILSYLPTYVVDLNLSSYSLSEFVYHRCHLFSVRSADLHHEVRIVDIHRRSGKKWLVLLIIIIFQFFKKCSKLVW